jgi:hypothetical protein
MDDHEEDLNCTEEAERIQKIYTESSSCVLA